MIQKLSEDIYRIEIPLPLNRVEHMNAYVIISADRNMIIDPGMADLQSYETLMTAINTLKIDMSETDIFVTHHHLDHYGLAPRFINTDSNVYMNELEFDAALDIVSGKSFSQLSRLFALLGIPERDPMKIIPEVFDNCYMADKTWPIQFVSKEDVLNVGEYSFRCVTTPGHSVAHTCLYEPNYQIFVAGDSVFQAIQYTSMDKDHNPLKKQFENFDRLLQLEVKLVLPGHGIPFTSLKDRIGRLRRYHKKRLTQIKVALEENKESNAYIVAEMTWDEAQSGTKWEELSLHHQFFHTRDSLAHMKYLEENPEIEVL